LQRIDLYATTQTARILANSLAPVSGARLMAAKGARLPVSSVAECKKGVVMNWDIVEGNWKQFQGKVKAQWGKLTDDHLDVIAGKRVELAGKLQESYGISVDEAEKQIKNFEEANKDFGPKSPS
jgi:uncharacterized protein YjbJ (UPF0337 family)